MLWVQAVRQQQCSAARPLTVACRTETNWSVTASIMWAESQTRCTSLTSTSTTLAIESTTASHTARSSCPVVAAVERPTETAMATSGTITTRDRLHYSHRPPPPPYLETPPHWIEIELEIEVVGDRRLTSITSIPNTTNNINTNNTKRLSHYDQEWSRVKWSPLTH